MTEKLTDSAAMIEMLRKIKCDSLTLKFHDCYRVLVVTAEIKPTSAYAMALRQRALTADKAFEDVLKLRQKVTDLVKDQKLKINEPIPERQRYQNGYYREMLSEEMEIEFQRSGEGYVISGLRRKDKDGFYYVEEPYDLPTDGKWKFVQNLDEGNQLWEWDDMHLLSGTAGQAIVYNGKVIKTKMTAIA